MKITELRAQGVRNLAEYNLQPGPGLNLILGENGAGKTSLLESVCLLSRGRSFRTSYSRPVLAEGKTQLEISAKVSSGPIIHQLGMRRGARGWEGRLDGADAKGLGVLARALPVLVFEPGSHELIEGSPDYRRRFIDWGVFHVEQGFGHLIQRYRKGVKQRNAALRRGQAGAAFAFDTGLADLGEAITNLRLAYVTRLAPVLKQVLGRLNPEIGDLQIRLDQGWGSGLALLEALALSREQDERSGHTGKGPHRAELSLKIADRSAAEYLSRGQQKILGLAMILSQARLFHVEQGDAPVILLDDLASELDSKRLRSAIELLRGLDAQVLVSAITLDSVLQDLLQDAAVFHVEHGQVKAMV